MSLLPKDLRAARLKKGLTQTELAQKVGMPQGHISSIEQGKIDLRLSTLVEIARVLDQEVMLIPRTSVALVKGIIEGKTDMNTTPRWQGDTEEN